MNFETIILRKEGRVAIITLNRPEAINARNPVMVNELSTAYRDVAQDDEVRVVVLAGAGDKGFCAGMDLKELSLGSDPVDSRRQRVRNSDTSALSEIDKPTIAALHGYVLGGGLEMALACDLRVAADDIRLGLPELRRGLIPGNGGTQRLTRLIGTSRALEALYTGRFWDAAQAEKVGLVNQVVKQGTALEASLRMARTIAQNPPIALRFAKEAVLRGGQLPLAEGLRLESALGTILSKTEDHREGVLAFREKRSPEFHGR